MIIRVMNTFDREAFGRRSFSEKRKASNGKSKEVVDKVKALREELKGVPAAIELCVRVCVCVPACDW